MFWKKKKKLPITIEDRIWIDEDLNWLRNEIGEENFMKIRTIIPTNAFYDRIFDGTEKDADFILARTMELMNIRDLEISLDFFSDDIFYTEDGSILTTPADINGNWVSSAGTYEKNEKGTVISIETQQLKDPMALVATISHELSHQILLGEGRILDNDEYLTDLTAISYGFGIFIGNSRFNFSQFSTNDGFGWRSSNQGYLPEQIIAYAMAFLSKERKENIAFANFLKPSLKKYFRQSFEFLSAEIK